MFVRRVAANFHSPSSVEGRKKNSLHRPAFWDWYQSRGQGVCGSFSFFVAGGIAEGRRY